MNRRLPILLALLLPTGLALARSASNAVVVRGARLIDGTGRPAVEDAGPPLRFQGYFEHRELQLMVESGLSPMQAIVCATRNAGEFLGRGYRLGTLEPGKAADFLVLDANPLENIPNTEKLSAVWQAGTPIRPISVP